MSARADRRAWQRRRVRDLRAAGCTCTPDVYQAEPDEWARSMGATAGELIHHQRGCQLGDSVLELNKVGLTMPMFSTVTRCDR